MSCPANATGHITDIEGGCGQGIVFDYIKEKNYNDVQVHYPSIKPEPVLKITISENSELSSEILKTELEDLLASKDFEHLVKDISYKIQVIKS